MHMDIILAILAILIVLAIVAVLFIKKRQTPLNEEPVAAPIEPVSSIDPIAQADTLINEQRYNEAAADLKRVLMSNPANTAAMLKLLQVYGLTNNHVAFDKLHHKIHEVADSQSIQQADFYRSLLEDDISSSTLSHTQTITPAQHNNIKEPNLDESLSPHVSTTHEDFNDLNFVTNQPKEPTFDTGLNFNIEKSDPIPSTTDTLIQEEDIGLDFDDFSSNDSVATLDDSPDDSNLNFDNFTLDESKHPVTETDDGLDLSINDELDFDKPDSDSLSSADLLTVDKSTPDDLSFESNENESFSDNESLDFDLSFDEPDLEETSSTETVPPKATSLDVESFSKDELSFDDFSLEESDTSFDLESLDNPILQDDKENEKITQLDDDFSFDLSEDSNAHSDKLTKAPSPTQSDEEFDFEPSTDFTSDASDNGLEDELGLDLDNSSFEDTDLTQEKTDNNSLPNDDFTIENDVPPRNVQEQHTDILTGDEADFGFSSDLAFDDASDFVFDDVNEESVDKPVFDDSTSLDGTIEEATQDTQATDTVNLDVTDFDISVPQQSQITNDFDFVEELDKSKITLDLANQYLSLGEHDSAKRLLEEVAKSGNQNQQETATTLLKRIG